MFKTLNADDKVFLVNHTKNLIIVNNRNAYDLITFMKSLTLVLVFAIYLLLQMHFLKPLLWEKKCRASLDFAQNALINKQYNEARFFLMFSSDCKTKDAKEVSACGKSLNGRN
jgi:hypothetical protein